MFKWVSWCIPTLSILYFGQFNPFHYSPLLPPFHPHYSTAFNTYCYIFYLHRCNVSQYCWLSIILFYLPSPILIGKFHWYFQGWALEQRFYSWQNCSLTRLRGASTLVDVFVFTSSVRWWVSVTTESMSLTFQSSESICCLEWDNLWGRKAIVFKFRLPKNQLNDYNLEAVIHAQYLAIVFGLLQSPSAL
jgi:hypothetical protein